MKKSIKKIILGVLGSISFILALFFILYLKEYLMFFICMLITIYLFGKLCGGAD